MILSVCPYDIIGRKGLLLFHQKCESAASKGLAHRIFDFFERCYRDILLDQDSTRIHSVDDMGDPEIQLLESAKLKALKSLPQSSLYWGSDLYHLHINRENVFVKVPLWFELHRVRNQACEIIELDSSWTKLTRNPTETFLLSPRTPHPASRVILGEAAMRKRSSFRMAAFLSSPQLALAPTLCLDSQLRDER